MPLHKPISTLPDELLPDTNLNRTQAALYISKKTAGYYNVDSLHHIARTGKGPKYRIWSGRNGGRGRWAVYTVADLDAWIESYFEDPTTEQRRLESLVERHRLENLTDLVDQVETEDAPDETIPGPGEQETNSEPTFTPLSHVYQDSN